MRDFIPVNIPLLDGREKEYLVECVETGWISSEGPFVRRFEEGFSEKVGRKYGIAVANGSAALEIAVRALGVSDGDEIILPAFTIISCAQAIVNNGAVPVLVDCDSTTWNMDVAAIEQRITPKTQAIMVVHIYGLPVDIAPVLRLAEQYGLKIIEDAAEAIGQVYDSRPCGSFGDVSVFSFYPNKHITTGEGGMLVTDHSEVAEKCRSLRNLCFKKTPRFVHDELGWNYRMTNMQAAVGCAQLENLDKHVARKKEIGAKYNSVLANCDGIQLPLKKTKYADNIYWVYGIVLRNGIRAQDMARLLLEKNIGTRPFFYPMHKQPVFLKMGLFKNEHHLNSEWISEYGFYLPSGLGIKDDEIRYVAEALLEELEK